MAERQPIWCQSDLDTARSERQEQVNAIEEALEVIGELLNNADAALSEVESNGTLGTAIVRISQSIAETVGAVAENIENQSDEEKRELARACVTNIEAFHRNALLLDLDTETHTEGPPSAMIAENPTEVATISDNDFLKGLQLASGLLRDVEDTLRRIDRNEAEELADVALTVANLLTASLQSFHASVTPDEILRLAEGKSSQSFTVRIELLDSEDEAEAPRRSSRNIKSKYRCQRQRVLWPPLVPPLSVALQRGQAEASKNPIVAVALGVTLWPMVALTTLIGTPIVVGDTVLQSLYDKIKDTALIEGVERTVAQGYQTSKLCFLSTKLVAKQWIRVASKQIDRHGGLESIAQKAGDFAVNRLTHPVESVGMAWNSISRCVGNIASFVSKEAQESSNHQIHVSTC